MSTATEDFVGLKDKRFAWYEDDAQVQPEARRVLEEYSKIPPGEVDSHVFNIRDRSWEVFPWPCVGGLGFLDFNLQERPAYSRIVRALKSSPTARHLDIGCCIGQDLRKLVYDGVPSERLTGVELEQGFIDIGYELFNDRDNLKTRFVCVDMLDGGNEELRSLDGSFDTIHIGLVLHIFRLDEQVRFLMNTVSKLKGGRGLIVGHLVGNKAGREIPVIYHEPKMWHSWDSWVAVWEDVGRLTHRSMDVKGHAESFLGFRSVETRQELFPEDCTKIIFEVWVE